MTFDIKDSGKREEFSSGMVRDVEDAKADYTLVLDGPMLDRWAEHLTKGAKKYAARNWMKAEGEVEYARFRRSALRHLLQWMRGDRDEDHAAAVIFNINGAEYVLDKRDPIATDEEIQKVANSRPGEVFEFSPGKPRCDYVFHGPELTYCPLDLGHKGPHVY